MLIVGMELDVDYGPSLTANFTLLFLTVIFSFKFKISFLLLFVLFLTF